MQSISNEEIFRAGAPLPISFACPDRRQKTHFDGRKCPFVWRGLSNWRARSAARKNSDDATDCPIGWSARAAARDSVSFQRCSNLSMGGYCCPTLLDIAPGHQRFFPKIDLFAVLTAVDCRGNRRSPCDGRQKGHSENSKHGKLFPEVLSHARQSRLFYAVYE